MVATDGQSLLVSRADARNVAWIVSNDCPDEARQWLTRRDAAELDAGIDRIWDAMSTCIDRALKVDGIMPGGLKVKRRVRAIYDKLNEEWRSNRLNRCSPMIDSRSIRWQSTRKCRRRPGCHGTNQWCRRRHPGDGALLSAFPRGCERGGRPQLPASGRCHRRHHQA